MNGRPFDEKAIDEVNWKPGRIIMATMTHGRIPIIRYVTNVFRNSVGPYLMAGIRGFPRARASSFHFFPARFFAQAGNTGKGTLRGRKNIPLFRERPTDCPLLPIVKSAPLRASHTLNIHAYTLGVGRARNFLTPRLQHFD